MAPSENGGLLANRAPAGLLSGSPRVSGLCGGSAWSGSEHTGIAERAGHGQHELITEDLPAYRWVSARHAGARVHWMAHLGGVIMASPGALPPNWREQVASPVFFGTKRGVSVRTRSAG